MEEQLVSFETAKLAKEKGFDEQVPFFYTEEAKLYRFSECEMYYSLLSKEEDARHYIQNSSEFRVWDKQNEVYLLNKVEYNSKTIFTVQCTAPTQALLQKWLRNVHNIHVILVPKFDLINPESINYYWKIISNTNTKITQKVSLDEEGTGSYWTVYEEALEKVLQEALNSINTK